MKYAYTMTGSSVENEYSKLIRDRIPEIIASNGQEADVRTLTDDNEFLSYLMKKVLEEAQELANATTDSHIVEEAADLREVIDAILEFKGVTSEEFVAVQAEKRAKRGGFNKRLIMRSTGKRVEP